MTLETKTTPLFYVRLPEIKMDLGRILDLDSTPKFELYLGLLCTL